MTLTLHSGLSLSDDLVPNPFASVATSCHPLLASPHSWAGKCPLKGRSGQPGPSFQDFGVSLLEQWQGIRHP